MMNEKVRAVITKTYREMLFRLLFLGINQMYNRFINQLDREEQFELKRNIGTTRGYIKTLYKSHLKRKF